MTTKKRVSKKKETVEQKEVVVPQSVIDDVVKASMPIIDNAVKASMHIKDNLIVGEAVPGEDFSDYSAFNNLSKEESLELVEKLGVVKAGKDDSAPTKQTKTIQGEIVALSAVDNAYGFPTGEWKLTIKEQGESDEVSFTDVVISTEEFSEKRYVIGDWYGAKQKPSLSDDQVQKMQLLNSNSQLK